MSTIVVLSVNGCPIQGRYFASVEDVKKWIDLHVNAPIIIGNEKVTYLEEVVCDTMSKFFEYEDEYASCKLVVTKDIFFDVLKHYEGFDVFVQIKGFIEYGDDFATWKLQTLDLMNV